MSPPLYGPSCGSSRAPLAAMSGGARLSAQVFQPALNPSLFTQCSFQGLAESEAHVAGQHGPVGKV